MLNSIPTKNQLKNMNTHQVACHQNAKKHHSLSGSYNENIRPSCTRKNKLFKFITFIIGFDILSRFNYWPLSNKNIACLASTTIPNILIENINSNYSFTTTNNIKEQHLIDSKINTSGSMMDTLSTQSNHPYRYYLPTSINKKNPHLIDNMNHNKNTIDSLFISRIKRSPAIQNVTQQTARTIAEKNDDIVIKKIFNFDCLADHQEMSFSDILRKIGTSLANPITEMTDEINILLNYEILKTGCPSPEERMRIREETLKMDNTLKMLIQLIPGTKRIFIFQNIVSPLLIAAADDFEGKEMNSEAIDQINQNTLFIFQDTLRAQSANDYLNFKKPLKPIDGDATVKQKDNIFSYKQNKPSVKIDNLEYELHHNESGVPYIIEHGKITFIGYHRTSNTWMRLDKGEEIIYSEDNLNNIKKYGSSFAEVAGKIKLPQQSNTLDIIKAVNDDVISQYIFTYGNLIEVTSHFINDELILITANKELPPKIILKNRFDYFFEIESTNIDQKLKEFITDNVEGIHLSTDNIITNIRNDGFSYNLEGTRFIKNDDKYYAVHYYNTGQKKFIMHSKFDEDIVIHRENNVFKFKWNTALPVEKITTQCGFIELNLNKNENIFIDKDTYNYLIKYGEKESITTTPIFLKEIFPSVYLNNIDNIVLVIKNDLFTVINYNTELNQITVKSAKDNIENITLYLFNNVIIRSRTREINKKYIKIKQCMSKRDLSSPNCLPILMSESLKLTLDSFVSSSAKITIKDAGLSPHPDLPNFFIRDNKLYFHHQEFFFHADIDHINTPTDIFTSKTINIFIKTLFNRHKKIASLIIEKKDNRFEFKETALFIAEKTGMTMESADEFINNINYLEIKNFLHIENMISEFNNYGSLNIIEPAPLSINTYSDIQIIQKCRDYFFPTLHDPNFTILSVHNVKDEDPIYMRSAKISVLSSLEHIDLVLKTCISELEKFTENAEYYIKIILRNNRTDIAKSFSRHLAKKFKIIHNNLNHENIRLVSINKDPVLSTPTQSYFFHAALNKEIRSKGIFAFCPSDNSKKIYISTDKIYFIDPQHPDSSLREPPAVSMVDTLLHELTHIDKQTTDIFYFNREKGGAMYPILDEVDRFLLNIENSRSQYLDKILKINNAYIDKIKIYESLKNEIAINKDALLYFSSHDTGILANYYLYNADFMTKIAKDIYQNSFVADIKPGLLKKMSQFFNIK